MSIYDADNKQFPYYVEEWGECFTEKEIEEKKVDYVGDFCPTL